LDFKSLPKRAQHAAIPMAVVVRVGGEESNHKMCVREARRRGKERGGRGVRTTIILT